MEEMHELYANKEHKMQFASVYDSSNHSQFIFDSHMPTELLRSKNNSSSYT